MGSHPPPFGIVILTIPESLSGRLDEKAQRSMRRTNALITFHRCRQAHTAGIPRLRQPPLGTTAKSLSSECRKLTGWPCPPPKRYSLGSAPARMALYMVHLHFFMLDRAAFTDEEVSFYHR